VSIGIDVFMECKIVRLLQDGAGAVNGAVGFWRETGRFVTFGAKAVVLATGGCGKAWKFTTNSWECTGDGMALALWAGADLIDMEAIQFHPTGMVWPPSARGLLVTEGVRGDGGVLENRDGERFMFNYISPFFAAETAATIEEADQWYSNKKDFRRPPELLPRDEVARAINSEVKEGRGSPHDGVFLDIASRRTPEEIRRCCPRCTTSSRSWPTSTSRRPRWSGPDVPLRHGRRACRSRHRSYDGHRAVRRRRVRRGHARLQPARGQLAFGPGRVRPPGRNGSRRASPRDPRSSGGFRGADRRGDKTCDLLLRQRGHEDAYAVHRALQETMQSLVGIIRVENELLEAKGKLAELEERASHCVVEGNLSFNPGWHLALDWSRCLPSPTARR